MGNYNRITYKERVRIEAGIYAKKSFSQIAKELGRSTSSIVREVKQNRIIVKSPHTMGTDCLRLRTPFVVFALKSAAMKTDRLHPLAIRTT